MIPQPCHHTNCKKTYLKPYSTNDNNCINLTNNIKVAKLKIIFCLILKFFFRRRISVSTLFQQFHKAFYKYYNDGGQSLYDPSKIESTHPECLKIFMMQHLMTKSDPLQKKEESFKNQGLWQSCIT